MTSMSYLPTWLTDTTNFLANAATAAGVPIAVIVFWRDRSRQRHDREMNAYLTLSQRYQDYLQRCLNDSDLATVFSYDPTITDRRQEVHMNMVMTLLESAYFMYRNQSTPFREAQWAGWNDYMRTWCKHEEFRRRYPQLIEHFDGEFVQHMRRLYEETI
jgi:hypothetical protein